jgi:hypothetical protein
MASAAQQVMLAQKYDDKVDPTGQAAQNGLTIASLLFPFLRLKCVVVVLFCAGWWMSEKLDGVRAYWSGSKFFSSVSEHSS